MQGEVEGGHFNMMHKIEDEKTKKKFNRVLEIINCANHNQNPQIKTSTFLI